MLWMRWLFCRFQRIAAAVCQLPGILRGTGADGSHRVDDLQRPFAAKKPPEGGRFRSVRGSEEVP